MLQLEADQATLRRTLARLCPEMPQPPAVKQQLLDYQLMALFILARAQNIAGARILEIGTGHGSSGYLLSRAAPLAQITSLTTAAAEQVLAERVWKAAGCRNVAVRVEASWDYLTRSTETWDMVFVDGDHNRIARDLPWFNRVREGGLFLCHDYSPQDSRSPSRIVYDELNAMMATLGRPFDVRIVDDGKVGMAGFYRRPGEALESRTVLPPIVQPCRIAPAPAAPGAGVVLRQDNVEVRKKAAASGVGVVVSTDWALPWSRTLFAGPAVIVPWDLLPVGFNRLATWDVAVPLSPDQALAEDLGTVEDRERTRGVVYDLRIPVYSPDLVFVRDSELGRAFLEQWRTACDGGDERLAFVRALAAVKPRICALPRLWLADPAVREALNQRRATKRRK